MLCVPIHAFNIHHVLYGETVENTIIQNSNFHTIYYSTQKFTITNLYIHFRLSDIHIEQYFNKYKCIFEENEDNRNIVNHLKDIEFLILSKFHTTKKRQYKLTEQLIKQSIKIVSDTYIKECKHPTIDILVKISGIYEDETKCGIIYKCSRLMSNE